jgi:hypothetical protein
VGSCSFLMMWVNTREVCRDLLPHETHFTKQGVGGICAAGLMLDDCDLVTIRLAALCTKNFTSFATVIALVTVHRGGPSFLAKRAVVRTIYYCFALPPLAVQIQPLQRIADLAAW